MSRRNIPGSSEFFHRREARRLLRRLLAAAVGCGILGTAFVLWNDAELLFQSPVRGWRSVRFLWVSDTLQAAAESLTTLWFLTVGTCLGSFMNVVVYRLPLGKSLLGSSHCPYCRAGILPRDNVPVLGWIWRGGRCRRCWLPIASRYPKVELSVGLVILGLAVSDIALEGGLFHRGRLGFSATLYEGQAQPLIKFATDSLLICTLMVAFLINADGARIPRQLFTPAILWLALVRLAWPTALTPSWTSYVFAPHSRLNSLSALLADAGLGWCLGCLWSAWARTCEKEPANLVPWNLTLATLMVWLGWQAAPIGMLTLVMVGGTYLISRRPPGADRPRKLDSELLGGISIVAVGWIIVSSILR